MGRTNRGAALEGPAKEPRLRGAAFDELQAREGVRVSGPMPCWVCRTSSSGGISLGYPVYRPRIWSEYPYTPTYRFG